MPRDGGLKNFQERMRAIPKEVREAVKPALVKSGEELAGSMRALVPVDEGDLRDSIAVTGPGETTPPHSQPGGSFTVDENQVVVTAGDEDARYPHLVEFGTPKANAQPFFWPAFRSNRKRSSNRIKRAMAKSVKDHWGKS